MSDGRYAGRRFLFVLGATAAGGSSELLARHAATALPPGVPQDWKRLTELPLAAFHDAGYAGEPTGATPTGNERILLDATLAATDLVVVSPLYWYSVSASMKLYLDYWGGWLRLPDVAFRPRMRGKTMWVVTAFGGQDPTSAGPLLEALRRSADYLGMGWGGAVVGHGIRRLDGCLLDPVAVARAEELFRPDFVDQDEWEPVAGRTESGVDTGGQRR
ncbi:Flavodoxin-like fold [Micromonospora pallida]|uniref:Flavodoxin-like fold n=1 Tax=Micromonospora pallida TaxID=145854 RepID=A0A1C6SDM2_9ACTN|nr:NAD(P)H-dependent oxidoreductase [Micromonospora pallida]SCL27447.1 Flavodoxin-like fold [Micromonospora pallida]